MDENKKEDKPFRNLSVTSFDFKDLMDGVRAKKDKEKEDERNDRLHKLEEDFKNKTDGEST